MSKRKTGRSLALRIVAIIALALTVVGSTTNSSFALSGHQQALRKETEQRYLERLRRIMVPLLRATDHPERLNQIRVKVVDESSINAGSAGGGQFVVTTGLLEKANDEQLRGVLAHEIAHDDLGHPAKMQLMGVGVGLGVALLENFFPNSSRVAPIAGTMLVSSYNRPQELEADRHAVMILRRAGYSKDVMIHALTWIMQTEGNSGGGFLSTHPATDERIRALKRL
ncbi:MAG TPA: M48 family metallopeptidase [Candidatus Binatia bacterium]